MAAVLVAVITGCFGLVGFYVKAKVEKSVGKPNGHGNVVQMSERILEEIGRLHGRLDEHTSQDDRNFRALEEQIEGVRQAVG
jgi:hypothetical protein